MRHIALSVVFAAVLAACRIAPHASPNELKKEAFTIVSSDGKALAYVVFPPVTSQTPKPHPPPKFYDLDGYRIFPINDENQLVWKRNKLVWALRLRLAEWKNRTTIAIDEDEEADFRARSSG